MRVAVLSDIHGNLTALEAVVRDLEHVSPDLVVHGGDLAASGSRPADVVDLIRAHGWRGVVGNTDEMLWAPERIGEALQAPALHALRDVFVNEVVPATRAALGPDRLAWLQTLPTGLAIDDVMVMHASPGNLWRAPLAAAPDEEFGRAYGGTAHQTVIYGHIHRPHIRRLPGLVVANSGSVSLSYDGDRRASYAVVEAGDITIRRVEYDVEDEVERLLASRYPQAAWLASMLRAGAYLPPVEQQ